MQANQTTPEDILAKVRVARPCPVLWEEMSGDERVRFCRHCAKNVYNLSVLTSEQAAQLILEKEGWMCVQFYARRDGTVLTSDCLGGFVRKAGLRLRTLLAAFIAGMLSAAGFVKVADHAESYLKHAFTRPPLGGGLVGHMDNPEEAHADSGTLNPSGQATAETAAKSPSSTASNQTNAELKIGREMAGR